MIALCEPGAVYLRPPKRRRLGPVPPPPLPPPAPATVSAPGAAPPRKSLRQLLGDRELPSPRELARRRELAQRDRTALDSTLVEAGGVTSRSAASYRFAGVAADRCSGEAAAEGASGPDADAAYWRALRALLGAEIGERAASELELDWLQSHHRLVVWKLASQQRCLAHALGGGGFSVAGLVGQLAHRHRRERVQRHRSVLSRIEDGTDPPSVGMVLCVAAVRCEDGALELTDGWRCLWAALDARSGKRSHALQLAREARTPLYSAVFSGVRCLRLPRTHAVL